MKKRILIAPLNWGLGHATRCIPIINALITRGFEPVIASNGEALMLLQKEFPLISSIELPGYNITYAKNAKLFKLKLLKDSPKLLKALRAEKKATDEIIDAHYIQGIISDNRLGVRSKKVPSVFMTHQLNVLSGNTTWLSTKMHQIFIKKFDVCWVPDTNSEPNLSGNLGHTDALEIPIEYIGPLSRFEPKSLDKVYDIMVLLSGPEPQRSLLEEKLLAALKNTSKKVVFVKGVIEKEPSFKIIGNLTIYNFMTSSLLERTINESELIISRSGYTTIMDLAKLNKNAFFIPTPGQYEQEYLAKRLTTLQMVLSCNQDAFTIDKIENLDAFTGLKALDFETDFKRLFSLFERE